MATKKFKKAPAKKASVKKAPAKQASKKRKKKPRSIDDAAEALAKEEAGRSLTRSVKTYRVRSEELRQQAGVEYITDPESRSIEWWYSRGDRIYNRVVSIQSFRRWANDDRWTARRDKWWRDVEEATLEKLKHRVTVERFEAYQQLRDDMEPLLEYIRPVRDESGEVVRYPSDHDDYPGLPQMPLKMGKMHDHVRMLLDMHRALMLLRGEATARTESMASNSVRQSVTIDPVGAKASFSKDDLREMARTVLLRRQPELFTTESIDIDHDDYQAIDMLEEDDDGEER